MELPAITNATLTAVHGPGFSPDYEQPATEGTAKFSGAEDVFFSEVTERIDNGGASDVVVRRSVVLDAALAVDFEIGDTLALTFEGDARTATVRRVGRTTAPGLAGVTRLVVEDG